MISNSSAALDKIRYQALPIQPSSSQQKNFTSRLYQRKPTRHSQLWILELEWPRLIW